MAQTILKKIWTAAFFSSFLINQALATEISTASKDNGKDKNPYADLYRPVQNNTPAKDNSFLKNLTNTNTSNVSKPVEVKQELAMSVPNTPVLISTPKVSSEEGKMDKPVEAKENKNVFLTYLNNTQELISKGVGFLNPNSSDETTLMGKYKKAKDILLSKGMEYIGIDYKWGGTSEETGFDCSGLVRAVFQNSIGMTLPRTALEMSKVGEKIPSMDKLKPGDLVFFNTMRKNFSHVGIYVGDNKFLHSPRKGAQVRVEEMDIKYWQKRFNGARRIEVNSPRPDLN